MYKDTGSIPVSASFYIVYGIYFEVDMRYFISFQKKHALCLTPDTHNNTNLAHQINSELLKVGYVLTEEAWKLLAQQSVETLSSIHTDLVVGLGSVIGSGTYEPLYRNFPQSVLALSDLDIVINAMLHYWSGGTWRPEDTDFFRREYKTQIVQYTPVGLISPTEFQDIFLDLLYAGTSISPFDKQCLDWYVDQGGIVDMGRIAFHETWAYMCAKFFVQYTELPTKKATHVLRTWAAYSHGDEGLKEHTRFVNPNGVERQILMRTLEKCVDLEDSFKTYRETWLRILFYLHPQTTENKELYPKLARYTDLLRNHPKQLQTLQSKIEWAIANTDPVIFQILRNHTGIFMRRLDHLVRLFGILAVQEWLHLRPSLDKVVQIHNHFSTRGEQGERATILASQSKSELVVYEELEPLEESLVENIMQLLRGALGKFQHPQIFGKKVYIDRLLYNTPFAMNNRASSLSLHSRTIGTTYQYTDKQTLRMYVHWEDKSDIDLSAFCIMDNGEIVKVGWNARYSQLDWMVYSGDNTGYADQNAEYIDINTQSMPPTVSWVIVEARIFRGPLSFKQYNGKVKMGWMNRTFPEASKLWLPETTAHAMVLNNDARVAYLMAYHPVTNNIVYLDMSMGASEVSTEDDAKKFLIFLNRCIALDDGQDIQWKKLQQGHVLHLLSGEVVNKLEDADVIFDANTTQEQVASIVRLANYR